jgi:hypothetical protein
MPLIFVVFYSVISIFIIIAYQCMHLAGITKYAPRDKMVLVLTFVLIEINLGVPNFATLDFTFFV